jgi:hypothetical protein
MAGENATVRLAGYPDDSLMFVLEREHGRYQTHKVRNAWREGHIAGVATEVRRGLFRRQLDLVAIIADHRSLWLRINNQEFDLRNPSLQFRKRSSVIPFIRSFQVVNGRDVVVSVQFWANIKLELSEWPISGDIFDWASNVATRPDELVQTMLRWNATASGLDVMRGDVQADLDKQFEAVSRRGPKTANSSGRP